MTDRLAEMRKTDWVWCLACEQPADDECASGHHPLTPIYVADERGEG